MADRSKHVRRLRDMRRDRRDAMYAQARRDAALAVLDETGQVTTEDVDRRLESTWTEPDDASMDHLVARKAAASIDHYRVQIEGAEGAAASARERQAKFQRLAEAAAEGVERAEAEAARFREALAEAEELAEVAAERGDATLAPAGDPVEAQADTAGASVENPEG